jgi:hypothetical protein
LLFPRPENTVGRKNEKAKIDFANSLSFAFYSRHIEKQQPWEQLTNKCSQNFVLRKQLAIILNTYETLLETKNDKKN